MLRFRICIAYGQSPERSQAPAAAGVPSCALLMVLRRLGIFDFSAPSTRAKIEQAAQEAPSLRALPADDRYRPNRVLGNPVARQFTLAVGSGVLPKGLA